MRSKTASTKSHSLMHPSIDPVRSWNGLWGLSIMDVTAFPYPIAVVGRLASDGVSVDTTWPDAVE